MTVKVFCSPDGRSTVIVTTAPGTFERIRTIADSASGIFTPSITRMITPAGIPAFSAPSPGLKRNPRTVEIRLDKR